NPPRRPSAAPRTSRTRGEDRPRAGACASGEEVEGRVELAADATYRFAVLEEPIPAGCEVAPADDRAIPLPMENGGMMPGYVRQEVRDNKVVFFLDDLPKGRTRLVYRLHAETPGMYRVLPCVASLAYFPEIRGNTGLVRARVTEAEKP